MADCFLENPGVEWALDHNDVGGDPSGHKDSKTQSVVDKTTRVNWVFFFRPCGRWVNFLSHCSTSPTLNQLGRDTILLPPAHKHTSKLLTLHMCAFLFLELIIKYILMSYVKL